MSDTQTFQRVPTPATTSQGDPRGRANDPAMRFDADKLRWDLLPPDAMSELVRVYTFGASKYADRNWEKGMRWSRCFGSMMRHCWAWMAGERNDPESGCHHLAHVAWNALALVTYQTRGVGQDDRGPAVILATSTTPPAPAPSASKCGSDIFAAA
jgi:hypothetical protein